MSNLIVLNNNYFEDGCLERLLLYGLRLSVFKQLDANNNKALWDGCGIDTTSFSKMIQSFEDIRGFSNRIQRKLHHFVITVYQPNDYEYRSNRGDLLRKKRQFEESLAIPIALKTSSYLCYEQGFQNVYAIHFDKKHIHIHFIMNSVNFMTGKGLDNERNFYNQILYWCNINFKETQWTQNLIYKNGKDEPYDN